jgi:hypothetical protein
LLTPLAVAATADIPIQADSAAKGKKKKKKKRCKRRKRCGSGCCGRDACFAQGVSDDTALPTSFGCCPAEKLCRSTKPPFPDQCCYEDESCDPTLTDNPEAETICCRPCNGVCCLKQNEECVGGICTFVDTARLPRTRRPG